MEPLKDDKLMKTKDYDKNRCAHNFSLWHQRTTKLGCQNASLPMMQGLIDLHHNVIFFEVDLVLVTVDVGLRLVEF